MRQSILKSFFSILFAAACLLAQAQEATVDTLQVRNKFLPTGLRIGTDVITLVKSNRSSHFAGWEVNADLDIHRYYLVMDYGQWAMSQPITTGQRYVGGPVTTGLYENSGRYVRFGVDVNFLKKDPDRNMFFLGFRIGRSSFHDAASFVDSTAYSETANINFGATTKELVNSNLIGHWAELTTGLRVKIYKFFWMGYTARMKFLPSVSGEQELTSYDIPGFGVASRRLYWGFNYQLFFRIPFTSKQVPVENAKK